MVNVVRPGSHLRQTFEMFQDVEDNVCLALGDTKLPVTLLC